MKTTKLKFITAHFAISILVACCAALLVFLLWYPAPLNRAVGVTHIFLMMLAIDMVFGPFFTWLVYKEGKKSLKFDLTVIILIQIVALVFGMYKIFDGRPAWIVFNVDRFELVKNNDIVIQDKNQVTKEFRQPDYLRPKFVATAFAKDADTRAEDMMIELTGGISIAQRPERYVELKQAKGQIQQRAQDLKQLKQFNQSSQVESILQKYPQADAWLPLKANAVDMVVLIDKEKAEVIKIVDLRPWN